MTFNEQLALIAIATAAFVASGVIWAVVASRLHRGDAIVPLEPRRPVPWSLVDLVLVLMAQVLFTTLGRILLREGWQIELPEDFRQLDPANLAAVQLATIAATSATLIFAIALVRLRTGATASDLGIRLRRGGYDARLGAVAFVAFAAPIYALQAALVHFFPTQHPLIDLLQSHPNSWTFVVVAVSVSIVAPLSEEFVLRVLFQGWLERVVAATWPGAFPTLIADSKEPSAGEPSAGDEQPVHAVVENAGSTDGTYAASESLLVDAAQDRRNAFIPIRAIPIVTSALFFALLHVGQGPAPIPLFFLALGLGYLYQRTHRLWPSAVVHFLLNTSSLAILWFGDG